MRDAVATARRMWALVEPVHVTSYFAAEAGEAFELADLRVPIASACAAVLYNIKTTIVRQGFKDGHYSCGK